MRIPVDDILKVLLVETFNRRNLVFILFFIISLSLLAVGTVWPKRFTSTSLILADDSNILQPLMQGQAETTRVTDFVGIAKEILFGENIMNQILDEAGWLKSNPSEVEQAQIKKNIKEKLTISGKKGLIRIEYTDSDALRTYITAKRMSELFIQKGEESKINESQAAYNSIEKQVNQYLEKLTEVEEQLRVFRSNNPDARSGLEVEVSSKIQKLTSDIEKTQLDLSETKIKADSLQKQLSGEAAITISHSREGQYRTKIIALQETLETLRLDYKETYPDIVRIKHQITDLKTSMQREKERREAAEKGSQSQGKPYMDESIALNPLYQQLRSDASTTQTKIATLKTRIFEMNKMLENEYDRAKRISGGEATLAKLTRDYQVNQEVYQDLLRRMERARVSKNLDKENQGLVYKIQEPAKIPLLPTGIRFMHFAIAGLILGLVVPIGLIYVMLQIDPRIRFSKIISEELNIPVLAEIHKVHNLDDVRKVKLNLMMLAAGFISVFIIYGYIGWLKIAGQL